jgi:hypothetical protein
MIFDDVVGHVLTPAGFALVSTIIELVSDHSLSAEPVIIAEGNDRSQFRYGESDTGHAEDPEPNAMDYFGQAIFRKDLYEEWELGEFYDAQGNPLNANAAKKLAKGTPIKKHTKRRKKDQSS